MTQLSANANKSYDSVDQDVFKDLPMDANVIIYEGSAIGQNGSTGVVRQLIGGDVFWGFAYRKADNTGGAAGALNIPAKLKGQIVLNVTGVAGYGDVGSTVYATDGNTFTNVATGASAIGKVLRWITGTQCVVAFEAVAVRSL